MNLTNSIDNQDNEEQTNIDLIYEYTESFLKFRNESLRSLNTKCAGLVGFSGALLKPLFDMPHCVDCDRLRIGALILLFTALISGLCGLFAKSNGSVVNPEELYYQWYYKTEEECKQFIIGSWHTAIQQLSRQGLYKQRSFNVGVISFSLAVFLFAISAFLALTEALALTKAPI